MNTVTLPFEAIKGQKLNGEQRSYLEGLFAGLANRGLRFEDVAANPAALPSAAGPKVDEALIFEERVKRELHPLDSFPLLLEHAATNQTPDRENIFRFKWNGLFYLSPNKEAFMARLRIPAGQLKTFQWRELAHIAAELTTQYVQITTRANLQMRLIQMKDAPEVLRRIQNVGLHTRGSGADNVRNLTANPTAGIDPHELIDTSTLCHQLAQIIINDRQFYDLPRKFNVAFDGGGLIGTLEDTNDIGVRAVRVVNENGEIKPGIYFRINLGGATGHKAFARDLGVLVRPEEVLKTVVAIIRVYIANGNRGDRKKARLKHLLETWTLAQYLDETEKLLGFKLLRAPLDDSGKSPLEAEASLPEIAHSHVGAFPQRQPGLNYIGVAMPVGQITPKQMLRLADLVDEYAAGEIRLTVWQNLLIPGVPDAYVKAIKKGLVKVGFHWQQSNIRSGLAACTGNAYCKFASTNTKAHALELAAHLEKRFKLDHPINIHVTGCPNSCAQHYIGDIGLLGTRVKVGGETEEGYHVFVGGGFGVNRSVGRQIFQGVSWEQMKTTIEKIMEGYLRRRQPGETFQHFTTRHDLNTLQAIFSNEE